MMILYMFNRNPFLFPMMSQRYFSWFPLFPQVMIVLAVIEIVLKGFALYKSARKGQTYWFIALLVINTVGILPLIYLLLNRDSQPSQPTQKLGRTRRK